MKRLFFIVLTGLVLLGPGELYAERRSSSDYFLRPQIGGWFGPITPLSTTNIVVDTNLGGGLFLRSPSPLQQFKIGVDSSYQHFRSRGVDELTLWPLYGSILYRLPIKFTMAFQLKAGAGGCHVNIMPDDTGQWDPMFMAGFEASFPAGRIFNIGLRIDYLFIYESYLPGARRNGHVLNTGITVFLNLGGK